MKCTEPMCEICKHAYTIIRLSWRCLRAHKWLQIGLPVFPQICPSDFPEFLQCASYIEIISFFVLSDERGRPPLAGESISHHDWRDSILLSAWTAPRFQCHFHVLFLDISKNGFFYLTKSGSDRRFLGEQTRFSPSFFYSFHKDDISGNRASVSWFPKP